MAAELLVGPGAAVVGVLRAVDPVEVGRAVATVRPGHVLARGTVLYVVMCIPLTYGPLFDFLSTG